MLLAISLPTSSGYRTGIETNRGWVPPSITTGRGLLPLLHRTTVSRPGFGLADDRGGWDAAQEAHVVLENFPLRPPRPGVDAREWLEKRTTHRARFPALGQKAVARDTTSSFRPSVLDVITGEPRLIDQDRGALADIMRERRRLRMVACSRVSARPSAITRRPQLPTLRKRRPQR